MNRYGMVFCVLLCSAPSFAADESESVDALVQVQRAVMEPLVAFCMKADPASAERVEAGDKHFQAAMDRAYVLLVKESVTVGAPARITKSQADELSLNFRVRAEQELARLDREHVPGYCNFLADKLAATTVESARALLDRSRSRAAGASAGAGG